MHIFLPVLAGVTACVSSVGIRLFEEKVQKHQRDLQAFQSLYVLLCGLVFLVLSGFRFPTTVRGLLLTVAFAVCLAVSTIGTATSYLCGPMSLSSVISSCSVVLPILFGCLVYDEQLTVMHIIGTALLLATFVLTGSGSGEGKQEITLKWILMVMLSFLGNGFGAVVLAVYARLPEAGSNNGFMAISFFVSALLLVVYLCFTGRGEGRSKEPVRLSMPFFWTAGLSALGCFGTNLLIIYLSGVMPASLLHPVYNSASGILVTLASCLLFRERMDRKKALILLLGICAVVFLNL